MSDQENPNNVFGKLGVSHLSASQITTFSMDPSYWFATRVLGLKTPPSAAMMRGTAVESGVVHVLSKGGDLASGQEKAIEEFQQATAFMGSGDVEKELAAIEGMVEQAVDALQGFGTPDFPDHGGQHKIELPIRFGDGEDDTIPLIGFLDLVYPDQIIDLKTTHRIPSVMSWTHACQASIYQRATNKPIQFLYASKSKTALLSPEDVSECQRQIRIQVQRMAAFLGDGDVDRIKATVPVIIDGFMWKGLEAQRKELFGI